MASGIAPGTPLAHYRILTRLGAGGMGEVYLADDTNLGRRVALKILPEELAADSSRLHRFIQEARAAAALSHPNVAHIYEIGEASGLHFIAMEFIEGQPVDAAFGRAPADAERVIEIAVQCAEAIEEAHAKGIVHRDLKPGNIMLTARGQVKIVDFGLARI